MSAALIEDDRPVAKVVVDVPLAHLDRTFDYAVPDKLREQAVVGARVRVRFSGQLRDGWLVAFGEPEPGVTAKPLHGVVSDEPILTEGYREFLRKVADHYAGTLSDVIRLAVPPRHAATEKNAARQWPELRELDEARVLPAFPAGEGFLSALRSGGSPRAAWLAPAVAAPMGDIAQGVLEAADATLRSGRSVVVVVPTARQLESVLEVFKDAFGKTAVAVLSADLGRSARYRNFLALSRGAARLVVGTRSAVFAPIHNLGLTVVIDDGNDSHAEQRSPHPHSREVAVIRTVQEGSGLLIASHGLSAEVQAFTERGWLNPIRLTPEATRRIVAPVRITGDDPSREPTAARLRLPTAAFAFIRDHLPKGPVLIQVPRVGHGAALKCERCRNRAVCPKCSAGLRMRNRNPECSLCGFEPARWECHHCRGTQLRAPIVGAARTAEELGRAFPGTVAINSSAERIRTDVPETAAIVVATPGAEPTAPHGYAGVLLLDTELMLARAD